MAKPTGGRGHKAPYETTHIRIPLPIKEKVQKLADEYREFAVNSTVPDFQQPLQTELISVLGFDDACDRAKDILSQKKSASESLAILLTALYNRKVTKKDLL